MKKNPYYDPKLLADRKRMVDRLRSSPEVLPPWLFEPDLEKWKSLLGRDDRLDSHFFDWQTWLPSLDAPALSAYQNRYPEPTNFRGFYKLGFKMRRRVPANLSGEAYWETLLSDYEETFGTP